MSYHLSWNLLRSNGPMNTYILPTYGPTADLFVKELWRGVFLSLVLKMLSLLNNRAHIFVVISSSIFAIFVFMPEVIWLCIHRSFASSYWNQEISLSILNQDLFYLSSNFVQQYLHVHTGSLFSTSDDHSVDKRVNNRSD